MHEVFEAEYFNPLEGTLYCGILLDPQTSDQKSVRINSNTAKIRTGRTASHEQAVRTAF